MKKVILTTVLSFLAVLLIITACNKTTERTNLSKDKNNTTALQKSNEMDLAPFEFPEGTVVTEHNNSIHFELPEGYLAYGIDQSGNFHSFSAGSVTCECQGGSGGCSPAKVGSTMACVMTTCNNCKKSGSSKIQPTVVLDDIVILNMQEPFEVFNNVSEVNGKIMLPGKFFNMDLITQKLEEIEQNLLPSNSTNKKVVPISLYGYVVMIEVADDIDNTSPYMATSSVSCNCNSSGSCPKESKLIAVWCDATNCKSCTMSGSIFDADGTTSYSLNAYNYRISID